MDDKAFYELVGIHANGRSFVGVEILGRQAPNEALSLAQYYADLWGSRADLYRVPHLYVSPIPWTADEMQFVHRVLPRGIAPDQPGGFRVAPGGGNHSGELSAYLSFCLAGVMAVSSAPAHRKAARPP